MAAPAFAAPPLLPPPEAEAEEADAEAAAAAEGCPPDDAEARSVSDVTELCRPWPVLLLLPSMFGAWFRLMRRKNEKKSGATDRALNERSLPAKCKTRSQENLSKPAPPALATFAGFEHDPHAKQ